MKLEFQAPKNFLYFQKSVHHKPKKEKIKCLILLGCNFAKHESGIVTEEADNWRLLHQILHFSISDL